MTFGKIRHGGRRGRRAVASHPKNGPSNPNSFSRYIMNERVMHHLERKEAILPCGYKVRESWAALRRSWQGFKIAKANNDLQRMKHYAGFINKVQSELGIAVTMFDHWLLDLSNRQSDYLDTSVQEDVDAIRVQESEVLDESLPDYDRIMKNAQASVPIVPSPRKSIFLSYEDRPQGQCEYLASETQSKISVESEHFYPQYSCPSPESTYSDLDNYEDDPSVASLMSNGKFRNPKIRKEKNDSYAYAYERDDQNTDKNTYLEKHTYYNKSCPTSDEITQSKKARKRRLKSCYYRT